MNESKISNTKFNRQNWIRKIVKNFFFVFIYCTHMMAKKTLLHWFYTFSSRTQFFPFIPPKIDVEIFIIQQKRSERKERESFGIRIICVYVYCKHMENCIHMMDWRFINCACMFTRYQITWFKYSCKIIADYVERFKNFVKIAFYPSTECFQTNNLFLMGY